MAFNRWSVFQAEVRVNKTLWFVGSASILFWLINAKLFVKAPPTVTEMWKFCLQVPGIYEKTMHLITALPIFIVISIIALLAGWCFSAVVSVIMHICLKKLSMARKSKGGREGWGWMKWDDNQRNK